MQKPLCKICGTRCSKPETIAKQLKRLDETIASRMKG